MLILLIACSGDVEETHREPDLRERATKVFAPAGDTRFDRWLAGEDSLSAGELAGLEAFLHDGCAHCHAGAELDSTGVPGLRGSTTGSPHAETTDAHRSFLASVR